MLTKASIKKALEDWWPYVFIGTVALVLFFHFLGALAHVVYLDRTTVYFLQVLSGNWSPDGPQDDTISKQRPELLVGGVAALLLNLGTILSGIAALVGYFLVRKGLRAMNYERVIQNRDNVIKRNVLEITKDPEFVHHPVFSHLSKEALIQLVMMLSSAYNKGVVEWETAYLKHEFDESDRERLREKLKAKI